MADPSLSELDLQKLSNELRLQQAELEKQNLELLRTKYKLQLSQSRYFELYDLAPVGYFTIDRQGLILEANLTGASLLGGERSALIKKPFSSYIQSENLGLCRSYQKQLFDTGVSQRCELRMLKKTGDQIWAALEGVAAQDKDSGELVLRIVMIDISVRKQAEYELKMSEERLSLALKAAEQGIYDLNVITGEAVVTPEYALMLGYDPGEFHETNAKWIERLHPDDRDPVAAVY